MPCIWRHYGKQDWLYRETVFSVWVSECQGSSVLSIGFSYFFASDSWNSTIFLFSLTSFVFLLKDCVLECEEASNITEDWFSKWQNQRIMGRQWHQNKAQWVRGPEGHLHPSDKRVQTGSGWAGLKGRGSMLLCIALLPALETQQRQVCSTCA